MERVPSLARSVVTFLMLGAAVPVAEAGERRPAPAAQPEGSPDAAAEAARLEAIARLKPLVAEATGDRRAEMLLRLAELYVEEARFLDLRGRGALQTTKDRCFDTPGCDPDAVPENEDLVAARAWEERAIKLYRQILERYPQYARADEASFYLGQALRDLGRADEANAELTRMVRAYPESRFAPDAWLLVGEYWFENDQPAKAIPAYQRAAATSADKGTFARYKLAWCWHDVGEDQQAVDALVRVIRDSRAQVGEDGKPARAAVMLEEEALKDIVPFAVVLDDPEAVLDAVGRPDLRADLHARLAAAYAEQGKHALAVTTLRKLLAEAPLAPEAPRWGDAIVASLLKLDDEDEVLAELGRDRFGDGSEWARANATHPEALAEARDLRERELRSAAAAWHEEARKLKSGPQAARAYASAERAYAAWVGAYGDGPHAADVRYGYAELLYATKKYDLAYAQYMAVVALDPKGAHAEFCAQSAVFAAEEMARRERVEVTGTAPVPLSEWERNELAALDQYTKRFAGPKRSSALYKSGWLLYAHNQFGEASARFNEVIAADPRSREAEQAANLLLDSFALTKDWVALRDNARFYRDQPNLGSAAFKAEVQQIYENASLKVIETSGGDGDAYLAFYKEFPGSKNADLALHDAAVHLHDAGRFEDAMAARLELVTKFPSSRFAADDTAALGFEAESFARFDEAARWYEQLAARFPGHASAPDALYSAAVFRVALGDWEHGVADYAQYTSRWPDRPDADRVTLTVGRLYEEHGKLGEAVAVYQRFRTKADATVDEAMFARLHEGLLLREQGQGGRAAGLWRDALAGYETARAHGEKAESAVDDAARMRFELAADAYDAYLALAITGPPAGRSLTPAQTNRLLGEQLSAKVAAMRDVEAAYTTVIETGSAEWGLAALSRVGAAHENLAETLRASYVPAYLTPAQREDYLQKIDDLAWEQEQKAADAYAATIAKARELDVYGDAAEWATRRLGDLRPDDYPALYEKLPEARFLAPGVYVAGYEGS